jgi:hypothetical protein
VPDTETLPHQDCATLTRDALWESLLAAGGGFLVFITRCECPHPDGCRVKPDTGPYRLLADHRMFVAEATDIIEIVDPDAFAAFLDMTFPADAEFGYSDKHGCSCFCLSRQSA